MTESRPQIWNPFVALTEIAHDAAEAVEIIRQLQLLNARIAQNASRLTAGCNHEKLGKVEARLQNIALKLREAEALTYYGVELPRTVREVREVLS